MNDNSNSNHSMNETIDLAAVRAKLAKDGGKRFWQGIDGPAARAGWSPGTKLPTEKIVPYVRPPEEIIPGKPLYYATSMAQSGVATGLLVESHMGRPTKIEGNPEHPGSLGGTDVFAQAATLGMYDPDRSQTAVFQGRISTWAAFLTAMGNEKAAMSADGSGLRIL